LGPVAQIWNAITDSPVLPAAAYWVGVFMRFDANNAWAITNTGQVYYNTGPYISRYDNLFYTNPSYYSRYTTGWTYLSSDNVLPTSNFTPTFAIASKNSGAQANTFNIIVADNNQNIYLSLGGYGQSGTWTQITAAGAGLNAWKTTNTALVTGPSYNTLVGDSTFQYQYTSSNQGIYASTSTGTYWTKLGGPTGSTSFSGIACSSNGQYVYASNGVISQSTNYGTDWSYIYGTSGTGKVVCDSTGQYVSTNNNFTYVSTSYGLYWYPMPNTSSTYTYAADSTGQYLVSACSANAQNGSQIYISTNYGISSASTLSAGSGTVSIYMSPNGQYVLIGNASYGGYLYLSSTYGFNWGSVGLTNPNVATPGQVAASFSANGQYITTISSNNIFISTSYGQYWRPTSSALGNGIQSIIGNNSGVQYAIVSTGAIKTYTTPSNYTWSFGAISQNASTAVIVTNTTAIFISSSYGGNWYLFTPATTVYNVAISQTGNYIFMSYNSNYSNFYISTNYGVSFYNSGNPYGGNAAYWKLACSYSGQYVLANDNNNWGLWVSSNYGASFFQGWNGYIGPTLYNLQCYKLVVSNSGQLMFALNTNGNYMAISNDYGQSFSVYSHASNNGLNASTVYNLEICDDESTMMLQTSNNGPLYLGQFVNKFTTVFINSDVNFAKRMFLTSDATVSGRLNITLDATMTNRLFVTGNTFITSGNLTANFASASMPSTAIQGFQMPVQMNWLLLTGNTTTTLPTVVCAGVALSNGQYNSNQTGAAVYNGYGFYYKYAQNDWGYTTNPNSVNSNWIWVNNDYILPSGSTVNWSFMASGNGNGTAQYLGQIILVDTNNSMYVSYGLYGQAGTWMMLSNRGSSLTTWSPVSTNFFSGGWLTYASDSTFQYIYAASNGGQGIWRSTNSGVFWSKAGLTNPYWQSVACSSDGQYVIAGGQGGYNTGVWLSSNYGQTWYWPLTTNLITTNCNQNVYVTSDSTGQYLMACVYQNTGIWNSTSYGQYWKNTYNQNNYFWTPTSDYSGQYLAWSINSNNYIYVSTNYGNAWAVITQPGNRNWNFIKNNSTGQYYVAGFNNGLWVSNNYGSTWTDAGILNPQIYANGWTAATFDLTGQYISISANGLNGVFFSTSYGQYWKGTAGYAVTKGWTGIVGNYNTANLLVLASDGTIYKYSTPATYTWISACVSPNGTTSLISTNTTVAFVSTTTGATWTQITLPCNGFRQIAMSNSGNYIFGIVYNSTVNYIYVSTTFGVTWYQSMTFSVSGQWSIGCSNGGQYVCIADYSNNQGICMSSTYGASFLYSLNWNSPADGFNHTAYSVSVSNTGDFIIIGCNGSMYISNDYGITWNGTSGFNNSGGYTNYNVVMNNSSNVALLGTASGLVLGYIANKTITTYINSESTFNKRLFVNNDTTLNRRFYVTMDSNMTNRLFVSGNSFVYGNFLATYPTGSVPPTSIQGYQMPMAMNWTQLVGRPELGITYTLPTNVSCVGVALQDNNNSFALALFNNYGLFYCSSGTNFAQSIFTTNNNASQVNANWTYINTDPILPTTAVTWNFFATAQNQGGNGWVNPIILGDNNNNIYIAPTVGTYGAGNYLLLSNRGSPLNAWSTFNTNGTTAGGSALAFDTTFQYIYATSTTNGFYSSSSFGAYWKSTTPGFPAYYSVGCSANGQYVITGGWNSSVGVYISSSYGTAGNWYVSSSTGNANLKYSGVWNTACDSTGQYMLAACNLSVGGYVSTSYGIYWTYSIGNAAYVSATSDSTGQFLGLTTPSAVYLSSSYGAYWTTNPNNPYFTSRTTNSIKSCANGQFIIVLQSGGMFVTTNYGATWRDPGSLNSYMNVTWLTATYDSTGQYIMASSSNGVYISTSYGLYWRATAGSGTNNVQGIVGNGTTISLAMTNAGLWYNYNFGSTSSSYSWNAAAVSRSGNFAIITSTTTVGFISTNYGFGWSQITIPTAFKSIVTTNTGTYIYATSTSNSNYVYISTSFGANWYLSTGAMTLYSGAIYNVGCSNNGQYICISDQNNVGIFVSSSYGSNFIRTYNFGISDGYVHTTYSVTVSFNGDFMIVGSNGVVYMSNDYGMTWNPTNSYNGLTGNQYFCGSITAALSNYVLLGTNQGLLLGNISNKTLTRYINSESTFNRRLFINSDISLNRTYVNQDITLSQRLFANNNMIVSGFINNATYPVGSIQNTAIQGFQYPIATVWTQLNTTYPVILPSATWISTWLRYDGTYSGAIANGYGYFYNTALTYSAANAYGNANWNYVNTDPVLPAVANWTFMVSNKNQNNSNTNAIYVFTADTNNNLYVSYSYGTPSTWYNIGSAGRSPASFVASNAPAIAWTCVTSDYTGQYMVACSTGNYSLYVSTSFGNYWTNTGSVTYWQSVASNSTGTNLIAGGAGQSRGVYVSVDSGTTWTQKYTGNYQWFVGSDSTGTNLIACAQGNAVYVSNDAGSSWTNTTTLNSGMGTKTWTFPAVSSTGQYMYAVGTNTFIWFSTNSGVNWFTQTTAPTNCYKIACDATGQYLITSSTAGPLYLSTSYGSYWTNVSGGNPTLFNTAAPYFSYVNSDSTGQYLSASNINTAYYSSSYGNYWTILPISGNKSIQSIVNSSSTVVVVGNQSNALYGPLVLTLATSTLATRYTWQSAVMSYYGSIIFLGTNTTTAFISTGYGYYWIPVTTPAAFKGLAMSGDGTKIYATTASTSFYTSTTSGYTWILSTVLTTPNSGYVGCSYSGQYVCVGDYSANNGLYVSSNYGASFLQTYGSVVDGYNHNFQKITVSYNGDIMMAANGNASLFFMSNDYGMTWSLLGNAPGSNYTNGLNATTWLQSEMNDNQNTIMLIPTSGYPYMGTVTTKVVTTSINSFVSMIRDVSMNARLYVTSDASLNGNVWINGNVAIGKTTVTSGFTMDVNGNIRAVGLTQTSDYRIKENVQTLDGSYTVDLLRPVSYYNTISKHNDIGLIAHEIQEHYPELVNGEKDAIDYQSVNYTGIIGVLIREIQELKKRVAELENRP
jgi:hypothetical protein